MNKLTKLFAVSAAVLYVLGVFVCAWYLLELPDRLMTASVSIDLGAIREIRPVHNGLLLIVGTTLAMGLSSLIGLMLYFRNREVNVVYVEKSEDKQLSTAKLEESDTETHDVSAMSEELLAAIRKAASGMEFADTKLEKALRVVCNQLGASQGAVYVSVVQQNQRSLELRAGYALMKPDSELLRYEWGEGLPGQVAKEGQLVNLASVPEGYLKVLSGLGSASPKHLLLVPIMTGDKVAAVVEIASFTPLQKREEALVKQSFEIMAKVLEESSQQAAKVNEEAALVNEPVKR
ncbi:GAF domain-containing protein [Cesiribacter andamanensis]|uniref:Putative periplasmic ligand-binding sensor domain protein n=1 Tax=Cesiribacter andamanensis AMV16 TaxID=1279009 RepID=M7N8L4_9BACT|nr:GAF domain-containing protein [Cesiribacter andamanensis]EMR03607.1 putative periplasmic ligand-binding sensor domain protein [Cesiribacter andamanensis AMV16]